jgi:hypothetical protein
MPHLTVDEVTNRLAEKAGVDRETVKAVLRAQAELAYASAIDGYPIAGIGLFRAYKTEPCKLRMSIGPKAGQIIDVPARKKLKVWTAKMAKDVILGGATPPADLLTVDIQFNDSPPED